MFGQQHIREQHEQTARKTELSIRRQCALVGLNRASFYDVPRPEDPENLQLMHSIDQRIQERLRI